MAKNKNLTQAKKAKNDEFYTLISDVEKELKNYKSQFEGKVVYCNCDDPEESNFWKFFELNFEEYKLKKLISTHYDAEKPTYKLELFADVDGDGKITKGDIIKTPLKQNGDFRSEESINLLKESDIVVTNPPFSLFREYVAQLMKYKKKFLIIGNQNAITYKEIFPLIRDNKIWLGYNYVKEFKQPNGLLKKFGNIVWFTNIPHNKRNEKLILIAKYDSKKYQKYDNYDAIEVGKVADIPKDYNGAIGVPISFLDKYNPEQFEIVALGSSRENFTPTKDYINPKKYMTNGNICNGNSINYVLAINTKIKPTKTYYISDNSDYLIAPYARILIKKKNENNTNKNKLAQ